MKWRPAKLRGFSLIELIIVLAIWGVILVFILPALNNARRRAFLDEDAQTIVNTLQQAQNQSISGRSIATFGEGVPTPEYNTRFHGYAVHIPTAGSAISLYEHWTDQNNTAPSLASVDSTRKKDITLKFAQIYEIQPPTTESGIQIQFEKMTGKITSSVGFTTHQTTGSLCVIIKLQERSGYKKQVVITSGGTITTENIS